MGEIFRISPGQRLDDPVPTSGMTREQAIETGGLWSGFVRTDAGMVSGWHHHGEYESAIFVLTGGLRMEFGPDGAESFEAGPGDFVYVGKHVIHRESNPTSEAATFVVTRGGRGQPTYNVEGPR